MVDSIMVILCVALMIVGAFTLAQKIVDYAFKKYWPE